MKMQTATLAALLIVLSQGAFAEPPTDQTPSQQQLLTHEQIQKGIAVLLEEGVIEWNEGHFVIKDQNALDQLRARGRVDLQAVAASVVCY